MTTWLCLWPVSLFCSESSSFLLPRQHRADCSALCLYGLSYNNSKRFLKQTVFHAKDHFTSSDILYSAVWTYSKSRFLWWKMFFTNEHKWQCWWTAEVKFRRNLVVFKSIFNDQEQWLFFLWEGAVINSAKWHSSTQSPTPVFVLAPTNAVTHKGWLVILLLPGEPHFNLYLQSKQLTTDPKYKNQNVLFPHCTVQDFF